MNKASANKIQAEIIASIPLPGIRQDVKQKYLRAAQSFTCDAR
jgi:hypothetical protein